MSRISIASSLVDLLTTTEASATYFPVTGTHVQVTKFDTPDAAALAGLDVNLVTAGEVTAPAVRFSIGGTPKWGQAIDTGNQEFVLAYHFPVDGGPAGDMLRVAPDGRFLMGAQAGTPTAWDAALTVRNNNPTTVRANTLYLDGAAGTGSGGILANLKGDNFGLAIAQADANKRTKISLGNGTAFQFGTDFGSANVADFWLYSDAASAYRLYLGANGGWQFNTTLASSAKAFTFNALAAHTDAIVDFSVTGTIVASVATNGMLLAPYIRNLANDGPYWQFNASQIQFRNASNVNLLTFSANGLEFASATMVQTTVGAAGAASALPGNPRKWLKFVDDTGTAVVVPCWAAA